MDSHLDDRLKELLNNPPDIPVDWSVWGQISEQLGHQLSKRRWRLAWLLLLLLTLAVAVFLGIQLYRQEQRLNEMQATLQANLSEKQEKDTVIIVQRTEVHDTVYIVRQTAPFASSRRPRYADAPGIGQHFPQNLPEAGIPAHVTAAFDRSGTSEAGIKNIVDYQLLSVVLLNLDTVYRPVLSVYPQNLWAIAAIAPMKEDARKTASSWQKTHSSGVAISAGIGPVTSSYGTGRGGNAMGRLDGKFYFGQRWFVSVGGEFLQWKFDVDIDNRNRDNYTDLPLIAPTQASDVLTEIYGDFQFLYFPVGVNYLLKKSPSGKFAPELGMGISARLPLRSTLDYQYLSGLDDYFLIANNWLARQMEIQSIWGNLGFTYQFSGQWLLETGTKALFNVADDDRFQYDRLQFFSLNIGIRKRF